MADWEEIRRLAADFQRVQFTESVQRAQNAWVDSFLTHNFFYLVNYIKKRFKDRKLLFLQSVCVDVCILDQLEASVEEAVNSETWIDLQMLLPSCLSVDDSATLISHVIHSARLQSSARVISSAVVSEKFISSCLALFDDIMQQKAQAVHLVKHILKSLCSDLTNAMINFLSDDHKIVMENPSSITAEVSNACWPVWFKLKQNFRFYKL
ncbi:E3 UFM1-protein ligase 1 [Bagarius yarrelli]|uniref:E3 UFM1-protein ligase 1 n=1 Tax=Bagarius yarrelli TaxID=175774 RepID=A0A556VWW6_BAGYA|nr:E3 UFM1-protein ligase 1 [Bagarius yarrelli]